MFKKMLFVVFLLTFAIVLAETFAKETPFVIKANAIATKYFNKVYEGPVETQWNKVRHAFKRVGLRANRKKYQDEAMKTTPAPAPAPAPAKPAAPKPASSNTPKSPKTGVQKSSSKKLWKDDKGAYNWKNKK